MEYAPNFSAEELSQIKAAINEKYQPLINNKISPANNVTIINDKITYWHDGEIVKETTIDIQNLTEKVKKIAMPKVEDHKEESFSSKDTIFSPLEADRQDRKKYWKGNYNRIDFAKGMPIVLITLLEKGTLPTLVDMLKLYIGVYMENVPANEKMSDSQRMSYFKNPEWVTDRSQYKHELKFVDGSVHKNTLVRFTKKYNNPTYPFNEFTKEMIANRLKKAYASFVRDVLLGMQMYKHEADEKHDTVVQYNMVSDISEGVDLMFDDIKILGSTLTSAAKEFNEKKAEQDKARHPELLTYPHVVRACAEVFNIDGVKVIDEDKLHEFCHRLSLHDFEKFESFKY